MVKCNFNAKAATKFNLVARGESREYFDGLNKNIKHIYEEL